MQIPRRAATFSAGALAGAIVAVGATAVGAAWASGASSKPQPSAGSTATPTAPRGDVRPSGVFRPGLLPTKKLAAFRNTYWYVPAEYLLAYRHAGKGLAQPVSDQTVWHFTRADHGFLRGCSYRSISGGAWSPSSIVASVAPNNDVLFGFYGDIVTVAPGSLVKTHGQSYFLMQVSTGPTVNGITHWAYMAKAKPGSRQWKNLPGTGGQSVPSVDTGC